MNSDALLLICTVLATIAIFRCPSEPLLLSNTSAPGEVQDADEDLARVVVEVFGEAARSVAILKEQDPLQGAARGRAQRRGDIVAQA